MIILDFISTLGREKQREREGENENERMNKGNEREGKRELILYIKYSILRSLSRQHVIESVLHILIYNIELLSVATRTHTHARTRNHRVSRIPYNRLIRSALRNLIVQRDI